MKPTTIWLLTLCLLPSCALLAYGTQSADLTSIQRLLDQGQGKAALQALEPILAKQPRHAEAILARSTARFLIGDIQRGGKDLERALALDPTLRQGWLNLGALRLSNGDTGGALQAFSKARQLAPEAPENDLNIGAVQLLLGHIDTAEAEFSSYLEKVDNSAQANLLIAKNYALANLPVQTTRYAAAAIAGDERLRLEMRTDPAFTTALDDPSFQELLASDRFTAPAGSLITSKRFDTPYDSHDPLLVGAVIDSLYALEIPFDHRVETTPTWALVWAQPFRIKIAPDSSTSSTVTLIAPPRSQTRTGWQQLQDSLFAQIVFQLAPKVPVLPKH